MYEVIIIKLCTQATEVFSIEDPVELLQASIEVTSQLADATTGRTMSLLPTDLQTTNTILGKVIDVLEDSADIMSAMDAEPDEVIKRVCSISNALGLSYSLLCAHL